MLYVSNFPLTFVLINLECKNVKDLKSYLYIDQIKRLLTGLTSIEFFAYQIFSHKSYKSEAIIGVILILVFNTIYTLHRDKQKKDLV